MNNNVTNKKHCLDIPYPNFMSDNYPFTASSIQIPNPVLKYNTVTFLSFREQSHTLALVSKAFNALATFAREEPDWRDHTVDATPMRHSSGPEDKSNLVLKDYLTWQSSKSTDKSIDLSTSYIYLEVFNKKIIFINKIKKLMEDSLREFILSLSTSKQINIKQIRLYDIDFGDDFTWEQLSKCQAIELLEIELNDQKSEKQENYYVPWRSRLNYPIFPTPQKGFVHFLQKCKQVKLNLKNLQYDEDVDFLAESIIKCVSLDPNFIMPFHYLQTSYISLNEKLIPILQYSKNLIHFNYEADSQEEDPIITDNFINVLAYCTRLESINIQPSNLAFNSNSLEGLKPSPEDLIDGHDQAFANLLRSCSFLRSFSYVVPLGLGDHSFRSLCSHPRIEEVKMSIVLSPQIFEGNLQCPSLKRFKLEIDDYGEDGSFKDYGMFTNLGFRALESANNVTKAVATFFPNLEEFEIYNLWSSGWGYNAKLTDEAVLAFSFLRNLRKLDFDDIQEYPSQTTLISLANHPKLEFIKFGINDPDPQLDRSLSSELISTMEKFLKEIFHEVKISQYSGISYTCIPKRNSTN